MENVCRLYFPREQIRIAESLIESAENIKVYTVLQKETEHTLLECRLVWKDYDKAERSCCSNEKINNNHDCELILAANLYHILAEACGYTQDWGIVTGVRPVKLLRRLIAQMGEAAALIYFREKLLVGEDKISLAKKTQEIENTIISLSKNDSCSVYISIPFCPTRCHYCSFVSHTIARAGKLLPEYLQVLYKELQLTGEIIRDLGLRLETLYIGGGTPTILSAEDLRCLSAVIEKCFDLNAVREYTVEAGRPDTICKEKLTIIKQSGAERISINPQTLQPDVLRAIGRQHDIGSFFSAFAMAREIGFDNINTDLIAGLPEDTVDGFVDSLQQILGLQPENITVHTLALKRASNFSQKNQSGDNNHLQSAAMIRESVRLLEKHKYRPYYLYRQSKMIGNQENTGWSKGGKEGLYNIYIMDETHSIFGCGAGAVTKLKQPGTEYLERIFNYKFPYEYNRGYDEMIRRKQQIKLFYNKYVFNK